uniref:uncharacterized protein n=1 Tax=Pristiophorus japonicus TaxID=55135 RepID=UPI00398F1E8C
MVGMKTYKKGKNVFSAPPRPNSQRYRPQRKVAKHSRFAPRILVFILTVHVRPASTLEWRTARTKLGTQRAGGLLSVLHAGACSPAVLYPCQCEDLTKFARRGEHPETMETAEKTQRQPARRTLEPPGAPPGLLHVVLATGGETTKEEDHLDEPQASSLTQHLEEGTQGSNLSVVTYSSTKEVAGPNGLQQGTPSGPAPMLNPRRLIWQGRHAQRQTDVNLDMVALSRVSGDIGRELLQAVGRLTSNIVTLSVHHSDDMAQLIAVMRRAADSIDAMWQTMDSVYGNAPQGAIPPMPAAAENQEKAIASDSGAGFSNTDSSPGSQEMTLPLSPPPPAPTAAVLMVPYLLQDVLE